MPFTNYSLDLMATRLSKFDSPHIPILTLSDDKTLLNHQLESTLGIFGGKDNSEIRHFMTNIVRRTFASIETYRLGRIHANEYVSGDRHSRTTPYFLALTFFETCISYSWQIAALVNCLSKETQRVFTRGDNSGWERLHEIYTIATKHSHGKYDKESQGEMPTTLWLTNDGIECISGAVVTFSELAEAIHANNEIFYQAQKMFRERIEQQLQKRTSGT